VAAPTIRLAATPDEVAAAVDVAAAHLADPVTHADRRCRELLDRFPEDQPLMRAAEDAGRIVGAALGFRTSAGATLRVIGVEPDARGPGLGRRLTAAFELAAIRLGATATSLGAGDEVVGFCRRLGAAGRGPMMREELWLPGPFLAARRRRLAETDAGAVVGAARTPGQTPSALPDRRPTMNAATPRSVAPSSHDAGGTAMNTKAGCDARGHSASAP
jgi:GNAT superfamily N-acetyltransferase